MIYFIKIKNESPLTSDQTFFLRQCLPAQVYSESLKYNKWQDRQAYLFGRYLLLEGLKKLQLPHELLTSLKYTIYGKPFLPINVDFNISHSAKFVVLVMSDMHRIGIDIEEIRRIEFNDFRNQFSDLEFSLINQAENKYTEFFKYWTIKEAVIKADGRGMNIDLKSIVIDKNAHLDGKTWYLKEIEVSPNYVTYIATDFIISETIQHDTVIIPNHFNF
ncbi:4'-phosphopantetheinyl transferase family protein [Mucilaginibacter lappiensis]|uniref:4'-phosphopantetheinyl transferase n=1 Tax=Mucilaginibacter lappiensis TaxID=354630 RepID=A0A841JKW0_9SPHI|nr:4'-phosphopantetheinyl transferase superfamily protein [Mucilaginibacter lappiensis]MBB6131823.1 4'-phosphopantetheinyl transferase [Mucilaginibacter lappiensis]